MPARKPPDASFQPNLYLVARFLDALARPDAALNRAQLQAAVGVNYDILRRYLAFLERKGLVVVRAGKERGGDSIRLTQDGRALRGELRGWIARLLGEAPFGQANPMSSSTTTSASETDPSAP